MGSWGYEPWENDTAADYFYALEKEPAPKVIWSGLNSGYYDEQIAAAWLLARIGLNFVYPVDLLDDHFSKAIKCLSKILKNKEWLDRWVKPQEKKALLKELLASLKKLCPRRNK